MNIYFQKTYAYWPTTKSQYKLQSIIKNQHVPDATWHQYDIEIKHDNGKFLIIDNNYIFVQYNYLTKY